MGPRRDSEVMASLSLAGRSHAEVLDLSFKVWFLPRQLPAVTTYARVNSSGIRAARPESRLMHT